MLLLKDLSNALRVLSPSGQRAGRRSALVGLAFLSLSCVQSGLPGGSAFDAFADRAGVLPPDTGWHGRDGCATKAPGAGLSFAPAVTTQVDNPGEIVAHDFDGDGRDDVAFLGGPRSEEIWVLRSVGDGTFRAADHYVVTRSELTGGLAPLAVADLNRDGRADLVTGTYYGAIAVLLGSADGKFNNELEAGTLRNGLSLYPEISGVAIGDLNGDRVPDLIAAARYSGELIGVGDGTFGFTADSTLPFGRAIDLGWWHAALGDFDGNGTLDYAACTRGGLLGLGSGQGDGTFLPFKVPPSGDGCGNERIASIDLNHDGHLDLVAANPDSVFVKLGLGDGTFGAWATVCSGENLFRYGAPALADLDGDGQLDLPGTGYLNQQVWMTVCPGNGDGTFRDVQPVAPYPSHLTQYNVTGDFNGDCRPDVLIASGDGRLLVYLNTTP